MQKYQLTTSDKVYLSLQTFTVFIAGFNFAYGVATKSLLDLIISIAILVFVVGLMRATVKNVLQRFSEEHGDKEFEARIALVEQVRDAMNHDRTREN